MMFHFNVEYWDDIEKETGKDEGVVSAKDMGSAVNRLVDFYGGNENIGSITIYELEDVITMDDLVDQIK